MRVSIIIPALNEEEFLPKLLSSIKNQDTKAFEIIVADGGSKDKTRMIAKSYGCKLVEGGYPPIARNHGAKAAKGDLLLFLDSDVSLPEGFISELISQVEKKKIEAGSGWLVPDTNNIFDRIMTWWTNAYFWLLQNIWPHGSGMYIFSMRGFFNSLGGFNESLRLSEDHDFLERAGRAGKGKIAFLTKPHIIFSVRRNVSEGRLKLAWKYTYAEFYRLFHREIKTDIIEYKFGEFSDKEKERKKSMKSKKAR